MPVTIQDLKDFGQTAGGGDQKSFDGLCATVASAEPPKEGQYGQMQRVQLKDGTGAWYFSAMDCPTLHQGQVIIATGRVKGNEGRKPYFNLTAVRDTADQGAATSQPAPASQQRQQGGGQQARPASQGRQQKTLDECDQFIRQALDKAEAWPLQEEQPRQALVTTLLIAWLRGEIADPEKPFWQDGDAEDLEDVGF